MTTTTTPPAPADPEDRRPDRSIPLLIAAGVLVLFVVGAVLVFGVQRPPSLDTVADTTDPVPAASIAYLAERPDRSCVEIVRPDGTTTGPWCDRQSGELIGWTDEGLLLRHWDGTETVRILDPETGEVVGRARDRAWREPYDHPVVWTEHRDGELTVRLDEDDTELWRVEVTDRYEIRTSATSADGAWVAMVDSADRLLLVPADGSAPPRVWNTDVASWQWPVWEGTSWAR
jgi:hypothetical protein